MGKKSAKKRKMESDNSPETAQYAGILLEEDVKKLQSSPDTDQATAVPRRMKKPKYRSFRLEKRIKYHAPPTPGTIETLKETLRFGKKHWRVILGVASIYAVLQLVLVRSVSNGLDFTSVKEAVASGLQTSFETKDVAGFLNVASILGVVMFNPTAGVETNVASQFYQTALLIIFSMALIWALRKLNIGQKFKVKDAYYKGMYPLVPFILVLIVLAIQTLPVFIANFILQLVQDPNSPIALSLAEQLLWAIFWFLMFVSTAYMVSGSIFALIVVTMENMTPVRAIKGAYDIVRFRRLVLMRRFITFIFLMLLGMIGVMLPTILFAVRFAGIVYTVWSVFVVTLLIMFIFTLYQRMLPRD